MNGNHWQSELGKRSGDLVPYTEFLRNLGKGETTGWRWRQRGVVQTINIYGKLYISRDEIQRFEKRALAGEFRKEVQPPQQHQKGSVTPAQLP